MLQVARLAPTVLGADAARQVESFVLAQQNTDGGFRDRDGRSDLYYSSFAVDALTALRAEIPANLTSYLASCHPGQLDFVHCACLARLLSVVHRTGPDWDTKLENTLARLEMFRTSDGGYNQTPESSGGSCYACFLSLGAYGDHGLFPPQHHEIGACLRELALPNGAWVNDKAFPVANVPATAAAVSLARNLRLPIPEETAGFLLSAYHPASGGFTPFPGAHLPDLLSTAVALHALDGLQADFSRIKDPCLDYVDSLWTAEGGFHGHWDDDVLDLEYTYYGLLALGHLAL
jgi:prenyltransferase beta subunit